MISSFLDAGIRNVLSTLYDRFVQLIPMNVQQFENNQLIPSSDSFKDVILSSP
jgi:hypothetical protein